MTSNKENQIFKVREISLKVINPNCYGELSDTLHFECTFCGKHVILPARLSQLHEKLHNEFHCAFCLRHKFYTKNSQHILPLTFRAIAAYYYYVCYRGKFGRKMYYSEIAEYLDTHAKAGLLNPVFSYDPESFLWFIDFSRVGKGQGKISCDEVLKTILNILVCFNLSSHLANVRSFDIYNKYKEAIEKFYSQRARPFGKKLLETTLSGCGIYEIHNSFKMEDTKNFTPLDFIRKD